jgi:GT2 family glycosyltransferase
VVRAVLEQAGLTGFDLRVVVVDNAPEGCGLDPGSEDSVQVLHEPRTGIPFARNRAVREAARWADIIAFIDDDELPEDHYWLSRLVGVLDGQAVEMATGPVRPVFSGSEPSWIRGHPLFERRRPHGRGPLRQAYTHNLAVKADVFRHMETWFDERLRYSGGSDTEFTRRAVRRGMRIAWVGDAVVVERVPAARATARWVLKRSLRLGANRAQRLRLEAASVRKRVLYALGAAVELAGGAAVGLLTPVVGRRRGLIGLGRAARGVGTLLAMARLVQAEEYRMVDTEQVSDP